MHATAPSTPGRQLVGLVGWLVLTFAAAGIGALASVQARSFYEALDRPSWAPPGWLFGPVWTVLYALMAVAAWWVWRANGFAGARPALVLYIVQLVANAIWSWLFFVFRQGGLAFAEVLLLWCLIVATAIAFWSVRKLAAVLLAPYLAWVTFACALTYSVWQRNPELLG
jgi:tryptophan-rich sensory protein